MPRYLTKSRFKLALECSAKLYYTGKKEYVDNKLDDQFLASLAEGGFQVGELAKVYYEGGHNIDELDHGVALSKTNELLKLNDVIIYEAAFLYNDLFVRADILCKRGNRINLIEVKAKSYDSAEDSFLTQKGTIRPQWEPYLFDIAFQYYVVTQSLPRYTISPYLMLADKGARTSIEGLNQCFFLDRSGPRTKAVTREGLTKVDLGTTVLTEVEVTKIVKEILEGRHSDQSFENLVNSFADHYKSDVLLQQQIGARCAGCEFKAEAAQIAQGLRSGFHECWHQQAGFTEIDFQKPSLLDLWDFRRKEEFIQKGIYFQEELSREDLEPKTAAKKGTSPVVGLSRVDRRLLQAEKSKKKDASHFLDKESLKKAMSGCVYPLHFIDFETTAVALPFNKDRRPYEQIAFQFSHHSISQDGTVIHAGQWINTEAGKFPNFDFVRALKKEIEKDNGSIFRYAAHENTILNAICEQLRQSAENDKNDLCAWIKTITHSKSTSDEKWAGPRDMIDMLEWVLKFYYSPLTNGSNSIKQVLPAILEESRCLQEKYSLPIYGSAIKSLNFTEHRWITVDASGKLINPYYTLPLIHEGIDNELIDTLYLDEDSGIFDGGAAMTAYARIQFTQMAPTTVWKFTRKVLRNTFLQKGKAGRKRRPKRILQSTFIFQTTILS